VLVEAGFALGAGKPSYYFVKDEDDLPFILRLASQARSVEVRVYPFTDYDDLCRKIIHLGKELVPT
jgi:nucleoside 2-deoxyribosyltransferase